jgi:SEC-C motif
VCVVSDHYPALAVQAREFLTFKTDEMIQGPLVTDVFLIDVLAEMLQSPLRLLSYLDRRVNYGQRIKSNDELTILAYHLQQNLCIDDKTDMVWLADGIVHELDTAMTVRREGIEGTRTPDGILTRLEGTLVGRILRAIENRADGPLVDLGFMLLKLNGETLDDLNLRLDEIAKSTRKDGRAHDFTLGFEDNGSGLTVHCGPLSNPEAAKRLAEHCRRRKYLQRAGSWFGLVVRADDGLPKFGLNFRFSWKQDDIMDEVTKGMARIGAPRGRGVMFMPHKIGRNEPCPCGSGKKFKKYCLN